MHTKHVAAGAVLGAATTVGLYYVVKNGLHVKALDFAKQLLITYYPKKNLVPLTHPPVGTVEVKH